MQVMLYTASFLSILAVALSNPEGFLVVSEGYALSAIASASD